MPDETTILRFRHLLEKHELTEAIFAEVRSLLEEKRLSLKAGTIVDATIIHAPSSTKNGSGKRDPEMKQTRKGNAWYFGMKVHTGTGKRGLTHSLTSSKCPSCYTAPNARSMGTRRTGKRTTGAASRNATSDTE